MKDDGSLNQDDSNGSGLKWSNSYYKGRSKKELHMDWIWVMEKGVKDDSKIFCPNSWKDGIIIYCDEEN